MNIIDGWIFLGGVMLIVDVAIIYIFMWLGDIRSHDG